MRSAVFICLCLVVAVSAHSSSSEEHKHYTRPSHQMHTIVEQKPVYVSQPVLSSSNNWGSVKKDDTYNAVSSLELLRAFQAVTKFYVSKIKVSLDTPSSSVRDLMDKMTYDDICNAMIAAILNRDYLKLSILDSKVDTPTVNINVRTDYVAPAKSATSDGKITYVIPTTTTHMLPHQLREKPHHKKPHHKKH